MRGTMRCLAAAAVLAAAGCARPEISASETAHDFGATERLWQLTLTFDNFIVTAFDISYDIDCGADWLTCVPDAGRVTSHSNTASVRVTADRALLPAAGDEATLTVTASNLAGSSSVTLTAQARQPQPAIGLSAAAYDFGTQEDRWTFEVWNAGDAGTSLVFDVNWEPTASWLTCTPATGRSDGADDKRTIAVTVNRARLPEGINSGQISITAPGTAVTPKTLPVTAKTGVPLIAVSQESIVAGDDEYQWSLQVWNGGDAGTQLAFEVAFSPATWLNVTPTSGASSGSTDKRTLLVTADPNQLAIGPNTGTITIDGPQVSPLTLPVYIEGVSPEGES